MLGSLHILVFRSDDFCSSQKYERQNLTSSYRMKCSTLPFVTFFLIALRTNKFPCSIVGFASF